MKSIREMVAEKLASLGPGIEDRVVDLLTEKELVRRTDLVLASIQKLDGLERDSQKLTEDQQFYDSTGAVTSKSFSKQRFEERKKNAEQQQKVQRALEAALDKNDWSQLPNVTGKQKDGDAQSSGENQS